MVIVAQVLAMVQALALGLLTLTGHIQMWQIMALGVGLGLVSAVEVPARQSFFVELVDGKEDLANAIALNSSLFHGARLIGPTVAGILIAMFPTEGPCFIVNGISYLAVIAGLLMMRLPPREAVPPRPVMKDFRDGLKYVAALPPIRDLLVFLALVSLVGMPYPVLLPIYAKDVLHAGPKVLGYLYSAGGAGALAAALWLANRTQLEGLGRLVPRATMVFGAAAMLMGCVHLVPAALLLMPFVAGGLMTRGAASNTVVQTVTDDGMRGRVVSLYALAVMGIQPFGGLLLGFAGDHWGVPETFVVGGLLAVVAAALFSVRIPALSRRITEQGDETRIYRAGVRAVEMTDAVPGCRQ
jgi:MFS family permease